MLSFLELQFKIRLPVWLSFGYHIPDNDTRKQLLRHHEGRPDDLFIQDSETLNFMGSPG
jgi:hypothetical protein